MTVVTQVAGFCDGSVDLGELAPQPGDGLRVDLTHA
jgi:hypothetical protein